MEVEEEDMVKSAGDPEKLGQPSVHSQQRNRDLGPTL